jgi:glycosyltransferase involved in cell wall biosynthesis
MKISVVIPLFNKKDTILRSLNSVLKQTVLPEEIIVVNDGSTDGSEGFVTMLNHPLIRLLSQPNEGVSAARNRGIVEAKGDWIAFLDADDYWDVDFLETIINLKERFTQADIIFTSYRYVDSNKTSLPKHTFAKGEGFLTDYFKHAYRGSPPIHTDSVCVSKRALLHVGLFPVNVKIGEDLLTWARLAIAYKIAYSNSIKSNYSFPISVNSTTVFRLPDEEDVVGDELVNLLSLVPDKKTYCDLRKYISHWHKMRLHLFIHNNLRSQSNKEYLQCIKFNVFNYKAHLLFYYSFLPGFLKKITMKIMSSSFK